MVVLYDDGTMGIKLSDDGINFKDEEDYSEIDRVEGYYIIDFLKMLIRKYFGYN